MIYSNFSNFKYFVIAITLSLSIFNTGCSVESKKGKGVTRGDQTDFEKASGTNFRVGEVTALSVQNSSFNSYGWPNKRNFNLRACLETMDREVLIPDILFNISDEVGGTIQSKPTDKNGCITWNEEHSFNFIDTESYFKFRRVIAPVKLYSGSVTVEVAFNPWVLFQSVLDLRYNKLPELSQAIDTKGISIKGTVLASGKAQKTKLRINSIQIENIKKDDKKFQINELLGLSISHTYKIRFQPVVLRDLLTGPNSVEVFNKGKMKVSLAIIKEKNSEIITAKQFIAEIGENDPQMINTYIDVEFKRIADLLARTRLVVTIEPLESLGGEQKEFSFSEVMKPGNLSTTTVVPSEISAAQLVEQYHASEQVKVHTLSPFKFFEKHSNLKMISSDFNPKICHRMANSYSSKLQCGTMSGHEVIEAVKAKAFDPIQLKSLYVEFCKQAMQMAEAKPEKQFEYQCKEFSQAFVNIKTIEIIESLNSKALRKVGPEIEVGLKATLSFDKSRANSKSFTHGYKFDSGLGLSVPFGDKIPTGINISAGGGVFASYVDSTSEGTKQESSLSTFSTYTFKGTANNFEIDVNYRSCLVANLTDSAKEYLQSKSQKIINGIYFCSEKIKRSKKIETYYLLSRDLDKDSLVSDNESDSEIGAMGIFVRGSRSFQVLSDFLKSANNKLVLERLPQINTNSQEWNEFQLTQEFPGVLSP